MRPTGGVGQGSVSVLATTLRPVLHYDVTIFKQTTSQQMSLDLSSQSSARTVLAVPTFMTGDPGFSVSPARRHRSTVVRGSSISKEGKGMFTSVT